MAGIADMALGAAPIAGGAMVGALAGTLRGPDIRGIIKSDMDLLDRIPAENVTLRAQLEASINQRITDLIVSTDKSRDLMQAAASYKGNWRDIVVFVCALLFTLVWWNVPHSRSNWLVTFVVLVALSALVGWYAARGILRAISGLRRRAEPRAPR